MTNTNQLTADTITPSQIRRLRTEAMEAGDDLQVECCDLALSDTIAIATINEALTTNTEARQLCADAINNARAQADARA